jgi:HindIII restriction endonuclease
MPEILTEEAIRRRTYWIDEIQKLSGNFGNDAERLEQELGKEIQLGGTHALLDHLRLCGDIPESYGHDSSEEKLYSKYTDVLLSLAFKAIGLQSLVLKERSDAADVEAFGKDFNFIADAKSFRLSRTAKNQKDFKIQAMDNWKRGKPYAMVVCPIYHLPAKASQIYEQASARNVCVFTYSHLALLVSFASIEGGDKAISLLQALFKSVRELNPSKDALSYWQAINRTALEFSDTIANLWDVEKKAASESVIIAKEVALTHLAREREKIMEMSHEEAIKELIKAHKLESRIRVIKAVSDNGIFGIK